jgi:hypothetical protein
MDLNTNIAAEWAAVLWLQNRWKQQSNQAATAMH